MKIQSYLQENFFQMTTFYENLLLLEAWIWRTQCTKPTNQRSAPNQPISDQHRINQSAISTESTNQRSAFSHHFLTFDLMIFFFIFFFTQVQTPVTLYGELWSILVVRLAHSANLRSRFDHVSAAQGVPGWSPIQVLTPLDGA